LHESCACCGARRLCAVDRTPDDLEPPLHHEIHNLTRHRHIQMCKRHYRLKGRRTPNIRLRRADVCKRDLATRLRSTVMRHGKSRAASVRTCAINMGERTRTASVRLCSSRTLRCSYHWPAHLVADWTDIMGWPLEVVIRYHLALASSTLFAALLDQVSREACCARLRAMSSSCLPGSFGPRLLRRTSSDLTTHESYRL
jgi:hypothetical protein